MPTIKLRRGNAAGLTALTLQAGEPGFVLDTGKLYIGNGTTKILINPIDKPAGLDTTKFYTKVKVNDFGQVVTAQALTASDLPDIPISKIPTLGNAALLDAGVAAGNVPVLDAAGKLAVSTLPALAIADVFVVAKESEMLLLDAQTGDVAVRTDIKANFILKSSPATLLTNWVQLLVPADVVSSVNGNVGAVIISGSNTYTYSYSKAAAYAPITTADTVNSALGKLEKNFDSFAPLASPAFTGTPTTITPAAGDSSSKIATTSFVSTAIDTMIIDGGTF